MWGLPLPETFLKLFGVALDKDASVEELLFFYRGKLPLGCLFCLPGAKLRARVGCLFYGFDLFWANKTGWNLYPLLESIFMECF